MAQPQPSARAFPRIPAYAWRWLQRTRPVVVELAARLTGGPPPAGFVEDVRARVDEDPFVRDVLVATVADIAFGGRVPKRRPPGAAWDRGLTWWAATLAGVATDAFERRSAPAAGSQPVLFEPDPGPPPAEPATRAGLVGALRQLLDAADGDAVPVSALRQLLTHMEAEGQPESR